MLTAGKIWAKITGSSDNAQDATTGQRGTPTPDSIEESNIDHTLGGLISDPFGHASPENDLDDEL